MKIRIRLCTSIDRGTLYTSFLKQKLNTNSSTQAELVGVSDAIKNAGVITS